MIIQGRALDEQPLIKAERRKTSCCQPRPAVANYELGSIGGELF